MPPSPIFTGDKIAYVQSIMEVCPPRYAEPGDVDKLVDFDRAVFPEGGTAIGYRYLSRHIANNATGIEIVEMDDEIAVCIIGDSYPSNVEPGRWYGDIASIGVAEQYRGRGLGELLLKRMTTNMLAEKPTGICLHTRVSNLGMQALARKLGYATESRARDYYAGSAVPEDAFFMVYRTGSNPASAPGK